VKKKTVTSFEDVFGLKTGHISLTDLLTTLSSFAPSPWPTNRALSPPLLCSPLLLLVREAGVADHPNAGPATFLRDRVSLPVHGAADAVGLGVFACGLFHSTQEGNGGFLFAQIQRASREGGRPIWNELQTRVAMATQL